MSCARIVSRLDVKCVLSCRVIWIHAILKVAYSQLKRCRHKSWRNKERLRKNMFEVRKYRLWLVSYEMISISSVLLTNLCLIRLFWLLIRESQKRFLVLRILTKCWTLGLNVTVFENNYKIPCIVSDNHFTPGQWSAEASQIEFICIYLDMFDT